MTVKTLAESTIQEQIRMAFDTDDKAVKNIILRRAADALDAKDVELAEYAKTVEGLRAELAALKEQKRRSDDAEAFKRRMDRAKDKVRARERRLISSPLRRGE